MARVALYVYILILLFYLFVMKAIRDFWHMKKSDYHMFKEMEEFRPYYLTGWTFALEVSFVICAILDECSNKQLMFLGRTRALLFNVVLFPSTLLVPVLFWGLWHIDRDLVFPKEIDEFYPSWLNHALHTFIVVPILVELLLPKKHNFVEFKNAAPILMGLLFTYHILFVSVYFRFGIWLYPVYQVLSWPQRIGFNLLQICLAIGFQKIGIDIQNSKKPHIKVK